MGGRERGQATITLPRWEREKKHERIIEGQEEKRRALSRSPKTSGLLEWPDIFSRKKVGAAKGPQPLYTGVKYPTLLKVRDPVNGGAEEDRGGIKGGSVGNVAG